MDSEDCYKQKCIACLKRNKTNFVTQVKSLHNVKMPLASKKQILIKLMQNYNKSNLRIKTQFKQIINKPTAIRAPIFSKKAFLIGCNYVGTPYELNGCINDVESVNERLISRGFTTKLMTDKTSIKPTYTNLLTQLARFFNSAKGGDTLFLMFSGHGQQLKDKNRDETDGKDEAIVSLDLKSITDDVLRQLINAYLRPDVTLIALFDSCHSATILDLKYKYLDSLKNDNDTVDPLQRDSKSNIMLISGCLDAQVSLDTNINNIYHGALTWSLLETLQLNHNISWRNLVKQMRNFLVHQNNAQIPQISCGRHTSIDSIVFI
jgi:hypothetical protein